jgi:hypothetical protein
MEHPDSVDDYFRHPVFGKKRLHHLFNAMIERSPISAFRLFVSCEENGSEPEQQDQQGVNPPIECRSPEENLALELARARAQPGERVDSADDLGHELARVLAQDNAGFRKIENLRVSAPTMAWLLKLRQEHQERDAAQSTTGKAA